MDPPLGQPASLRLQGKPRGKEKKHHILLFRYINSIFLFHPWPILDDTVPLVVPLLQCFSDFSGLKRSFKNSKQTSRKTWTHNSEKGSPIWISVRVGLVNLPFSPPCQKLIEAPVPLEQAPCSFHMCPSGGPQPTLDLPAPKTSQAWGQHWAAEIISLSLQRTVL